jgi:hypothetical protein
VRRLKLLKSPTAIGLITVLNITDVSAFDTAVDTIPHQALTMGKDLIPKTSIIGSSAPTDSE